MLNLWRDLKELSQAFLGHAHLSGNGAYAWAGGASTHKPFRLNPFAALDGERPSPAHSHSNSGASAPEPYDPREGPLHTARIILERLQETAHKAASWDDVYASAVDAIREGLGSTSARLFLREGVQSDFYCMVAVPQERHAHPVAPPLCLKKDAFAIRRLGRLGAPLELDPGDFAAWEHGLQTSFPEQLRARQQEIETLQIARARLLVPLEIRGEFRGLLVFGPREDRTDYSRRQRELVSEVAAQFASLIEYSQSPPR